MKSVRASLTPLLMAALLGGCAGGGETGTGLINTDPVVSLGSITGFGSVYVNGVHFSTSGSSVSLNGSGANETDLKIGMVVKIRGNIGSNGVYDGVASAIEYDNELKGQVTAVDSINGTITVMGQTVIMDNQTQIEGALAVALYNVVEVSGYADGLGNVHATLIEVKSASYTPGDEIELKGTISNLDTDTFTIGSQLVNFASANINATLKNGALVEIKSTDGFSGTTLIANRIEIKNINGREFEGEEGQELELEGLVTAKDTINSTITVNGYTVTVDSSIINSFSVGSRIEVKGQFDSSGQLILAEYEERISADLEIDGLITVDQNSKPNIVTLFGQDFIITPQTIMNDERDNGYTPVRYFSIKDMASGDRVEIRAYQSNNSWIATRVDRGNVTIDPYIVKGVITATDNTATLTIKDSFVIDIATNALSLNGKTVGDEVEVEVDASLVATAVN